MNIRFQTFEQIHNRKGVGSTRIRVHNLIKYWPEADLYKYGEKPDVFIFQKVYVTDTYKLPITYPGIKILDICDPDWYTHHCWLKSTVDGVDAITCPSEALKEFIEQLTDKPVRVIKDRFDLSEFPEPKKHTGDTKSVVWFGYSHNADVLRDVVFSCAKRNLKLVVISDSDPEINRVHDDFKDYKFIPYKQETLYKELQKYDVCVLPKGQRPQDRFKSDNKTTIARLCGLPVAVNSDELDELKTAEQRNADVAKWYTKTMKEYDCQESVKEYKELIQEISQSRESTGK